MAKYTIEDVEILRQKSGISYEEAVNLLEYHNGSLARAMMDLEKNGRLKNDKGASQNHKGYKGVFDFLFRLRVKVRKAETTILNLSALFMIAAILTAPHLCVAGLICIFVLGYRISFERNSRDFAADDFDTVVRNAKTNVQRTVADIARQFSPAQGEEKATASSQGDPQRSQSAASGTRPVNVPFSDAGQVDVRDDGDGYHEADIR